MSITFHQFILKTYDETELLILCDSDDDLKNAKADFSDGMSFREKARRLIDYCERRGLLSKLWDKVKEERPNPWKDYQMPAEEPTSRAGRMCENRKEVEEIFREIKSVERMDSQTEPTETPQDKTHPLLKEDTELKKWFAETLNTDEQIFFLTAALFSGIEKHEFLNLYEGINKVLQPGNSQVEKRE